MTALPGKLTTYLVKFQENQYKSASFYQVKRFSLPGNLLMKLQANTLNRTCDVTRSDIWVRSHQVLGYASNAYYLH